MNQLQAKLVEHSKQQQAALESLLRRAHGAFDAAWRDKVLLLPLQLVEQCQQWDADSEEFWRECSEQCELQQRRRDHGPVEWICAPWLHSGSWRLLILHCDLTDKSMLWTALTHKETRNMMKDSDRLRLRLQDWCVHMKWAEAGSKTNFSESTPTTVPEDIDAGLSCLAHNFRRFGEVRGQLSKVGTEEDSVMRDVQEKRVSTKVPAPGSK